MQNRLSSSNTHLILALSLGIALQACASSTPEKLATDFRSALSKGDIDAALALGDFKNTIPTLKWAYLKGVTNCVYDSVCRVSVKADDATAIAKRAAQQLKQGFEYEQEPSGLLVLTMESRKPGAFKGKIEMPFGKIDGQYLILTGRYSAKKLAEMRAQTNAQLLDAMFAQGIEHQYPGKIFRTDWKTAVTVLPAGGGEVGAAYAAEVARDYLRYSTGDVGAVLSDGNEFVQKVFGEKDFDGAPVAESLRALQLRLESVRMLVSIKVLGGYQLGDDVVLDTEGTAENGWIDRGPILLERNADGKFEYRFGKTVSYPK